MKTTIFNMRKDFRPNIFYAWLEGMPIKVYVYYGISSKNEPAEVFMRVGEEVLVVPDE